MTSPGSSIASQSSVVPSLDELIALANRVSRQYRTHPAPSAPPGNHRAMHLSRGMDFAESRPYQPGDDLRTMDWRQMARHGRPYTKLYQEEHERPVSLLVDLGSSMRFGTRCCYKSVQAARAAAWLAWSSVAAGDRVGGVIWDGARGHGVPARSRRQGALALLKRLAELGASPAVDSAQTLTATLGSLVRSRRPGSQVVIISDFAGIDEDMAREITALARGAELALIHVYDPFEADPPSGSFRLTDGKQRLNVDLGPESAYRAEFIRRQDNLKKLAGGLAIPLVALSTDAEAPRVLAQSLGAGRRP